MYLNPLAKKTISEKSLATSYDPNCSQPVNWDHRSKNICQGSYI